MKSSEQLESSALEGKSYCDKLFAIEKNLLYVQLMKGINDVKNFQSLFWKTF